MLAGSLTTAPTELNEAISQAVTGLREAGYSWAETAVRVGVARRAALPRWDDRQ